MAMEGIEKLEQRKAALQAELGGVGDLRPGSLVERYRSCGKPGCHCGRPGAKGHGPSWSLTHAQGGKTVTHIIPAEAVAEARAQLAEYRRFRQLVTALVDTGEKLCGARIRSRQAGSEEAAKKGASKQPSRRKSKSRSRR